MEFFSNYKYFRPETTPKTTFDESIPTLIANVMTKPSTLSHLFATPTRSTTRRMTKKPLMTSTCKLQKYSGKVQQKRYIDLNAFIILDQTPTRKTTTERDQPIYEVISANYYFD